MKPWKGLLGIALLVGWLDVGAGTASAAWNNVFQVCCHGCRSQASSSYFAPTAPPSGCCPSVSYVQRCYYQPVTTYKMETRVEAVTSYRTSYYAEPCTSYKYVSYYDPCTGCCKRCVQPVTSYRIRSQCNPVVSYVQRCQMVPVTTMRQSFYLQPVVTYNCPQPCADGGCGPNSPQPAPNLSEQPGGGSANPGISEQPGGGGGNGLLPPQQLPQGNGTGNRFPQTPPPPLANPALRLDRTAGLNQQSPRLAGQVVHDDRFTPRTSTQIVFVNASRQSVRQSANTDALGRFNVTLPEGDWWIYVTGSEGKSIYHSTIRMQPADDRLVTVVSR